MDTQARKDRLIQFIQNLSDQDQLEKFESMIPGNGDWVNQLSPEEISGLEKAQQQVRNGQTMTSQEVWSNFNQHFGK